MPRCGGHLGRVEGAEVARHHVLVPQESSLVVRGVVRDGAGDTGGKLGELGGEAPEVQLGAAGGEVERVAEARDGGGVGDVAERVLPRSRRRRGHPQERSPARSREVGVEERTGGEREEGKREG